MMPLVSFVTELGLFLSENRCIFLEAELLRLMPSFLSERTPLVSFVTRRLFMAVIQKKTNELESMMASFAAIPDFEKAGTDPKKDKRLQEDKKK